MRHHSISRIRVGVDNMIANLILQSFFFHFISCRGLNSDKVGLTTCSVLFIVLLYQVHCHVHNIAEALLYMYNVMIPTCVIVRYLPSTMYIYQVCELHKSSNGVYIIYNEILQ